MTDRKYLESKGWTLDHEKRQGYIKWLYWKEPNGAQVLDTACALYSQIRSEERRTHQIAYELKNESKFTIELGSFEDEHAQRGDRLTYPIRLRHGLSEWLLGSVDDLFDKLSEVV